MVGSGVVGARGWGWWRSGVGVVGVRVGGRGGGVMG